MENSPVIHQVLFLNSTSLTSMLVGRLSYFLEATYPQRLPLTLCSVLVSCKTLSTGKLFGYILPQTQSYQPKAKLILAGNGEKN